MSYFECNLPLSAPKYIHDSKKHELVSLFAKVHQRHRKLEDALLITGLDGETFAEYAHELFRDHYDRFEKMSVEEMADYIALVHTPGYEAKKRLEWPNAIVLCDTAFLTTQEWEAVRHIGIGGSDAAAIMGISPYTTRFKLYHDKKWTPQKDFEGINENGAVFDNTAARQQAIFERGHYLENKVIETFCEISGAERIPETRMFQSKIYPAAIADVDAVLKMPDGEIRLFEAKSTILENMQAWEYPKIPVYYKTQMRHYGAVLNDERVHGINIGCLFVNDRIFHGNYLGSDYNAESYVSRYMVRDTMEEAAQMNEIEKFYNQNLLDGVVPSWSTASRNDKLVDEATLNSIIGDADKALEVVQLEENTRNTVEQFLFLKGQKSQYEQKAKSIKEQMDVLKLPIIEQLGQATEGRLEILDAADGEYYEVTYSPRPKTVVDTEILKERYPEAYAECVCIDECAFRVFSLKTKKPKVKKAK